MPTYPAYTYTTGEAYPVVWALYLVPCAKASSSRVGPSPLGLPVLSLPSPSMIATPPPGMPRPRCTPPEAPRPGVVPLPEVKSPRAGPSRLHAAPPPPSASYAYAPIAAPVPTHPRIGAHILAPTATAHPPQSHRGPTRLRPPIVDPLLAVAGTSHSRPRLEWDLANERTSTRVAAADLQRPAAVLDVAAGYTRHGTAQPRPARSITLVFPRLPLRIVVHPTGVDSGDRHHGHDSHAPRYVTVGDVLGTLHHALHAPLPPEEWAALSPREQTHLASRVASRRRAEGFWTETNALTEKAVKSIDFLGRRRRFAGIRPAKRGEAPIDVRMDGDSSVFVVETEAVDS
ncbi:uncharacterized protein BXZ73DRAFT_79476 [Epithele typhae]|uniref:uncharacterized protein n=1 Tax=Epithele typhae TaxID=378194 RepID=UPI002007BE2E|nr:uncharacterized protein BXZ73DRAFT_79476 [Epithele typhae]KAH9923405.1 hypothetical protein BXZ73DRAFT_79476 [Epithele typhae]